MKRIISLLTAAILTLALLVACAKPAAPLTASELLDLGEKYLLELDYEQAIVQFLAVIEVEPMNARAYTGAAEAYLALGRTDDAIALLERGFAATGDASIAALLEELETQQVSEPSAEPAAIMASIYELTAEENELCQELISAFKSEDYLAAGAIVDGDLFKQLFSKVETNEIIRQDSDASLLIYPNGYVYYGDYANAQRSGYGVWFRGQANASRYIFYKGQWENDLPNGQGAQCYLSGGGLLEDGAESFNGGHAEHAGMFKDGLYNGTFSVTWVFDNGKIHNWTPTYVMGAAQLIPYPEREDDGANVIAICDCGEVLGDPARRTNSVFGLFE